VKAGIGLVPTELYPGVALEEVRARIGAPFEVALLSAVSGTSHVAARRAKNPPRKGLLGTFVSGYDIYSKSLEERLQQIDDVVDRISGRAGRDYPGKQLDMGREVFGKWQSVKILRP
jgi:hypothetical protein